MLILQRKEGESLLIGDEVEVTVLSVEAGRAEGGRRGQPGGGGRGGLPSGAAGRSEKAGKRKPI